MNKERVYKEIEEHYRVYRDGLVKRFTGKLGSRSNAEEVLQTAYLRALEYWQSKDGRPIENWFSGILTNAIADFKREDRLHGATIGTDELAEVLVAPGPDQFLEQIGREVERDIQAERERDRDILRYYFIQQYTPRDIGKLVEQSDAAIRQIIHRFREKLRERYV